MLIIHKKPPMYFNSKTNINFVNRNSIENKGKGVIPTPHPPFSKIQDVPTFPWFIGKTKVLNNSYNQFVYNFYPQSILVLEKCLQKR